MTILPKFEFELLKYFIMKKYNFFLLTLWFFCAGYNSFSQWNDQMVPTFYNLYAIETVTEDLVFTGGYGGALMRSNDRGDNWEVLSFGSYDWVNKIHFMNENKGWIVTSDAMADGTGDIMFTTDGGDSWTSVHAEYSYTAMDWVNEDVCFVGTNEGDVLSSVDGGETWSVLTTPTDAYVSAIQFFDANHGFVVSADSYLMYTANGGESWEQYYHNGIRNIFFHNLNEGFSVDDYGKIGKTTDGGVTFEYTETPYDFKIMDVEFFNEDVGYVVGGLDCSDGSCTPKPVVLTTNDGGLTWIDNSHPLEEEYICFYEVALTTGGTPFLAGSNGAVMTNALFSGISKIESNDLMVYPNPTHGDFSVSIPQNASSIIIYDSVGKISYSANVKASTVQNLHVSNLMKGLYLIELKDEEGNRIAICKIQLL